MAYALSPIDLIPDFIPILGYLDDLVLLPIGIYLSVKLIPAPLWLEFQAHAELMNLDLPKNKRAGAIIGLIFCVGVGASGYAIWLFCF